MIPKISVTDGLAGTKGSVTVWLPLVALVPAQLSPEAPPVPEQLIAFDDFQVKVVDCPAVMVVGDADSVAVTAGHVQTTATCDETAGVPVAVQLTL